MGMFDHVHKVLAHEILGAIRNKAARSQAVRVLEQLLGPLERNSILPNLPHAAHLALEVAVHRDLKNQSIERPKNPWRFHQLLKIWRETVHEPSLSKHLRYWKGPRQECAASPFYRF